MIRRSTLIAVEVLLGLVAALAIGVGVAWWRLSQGPIELNAMREHVQAELSAARSGRPVGLESVELGWRRARPCLVSCRRGADRTRHPAAVHRADRHLAR
jgi:hypothetical protein